MGAAVDHRANRMEELGSQIQLQRTTTEDGQTTEKRGRINADVFSRSAKSLGRGFESAYADLVAIHEARGGLERVGRGGEAKIVKAEAAAIKKWADSRGLIFDSADFDTDWKNGGGNALCIEELPSGGNDVYAARMRCPVSS